jgi:hypothetical protein
MPERVTLSASRIKTVQSCSWLYWFKYFLKAPDKSNDGAKRGTVCHEIFEFLGENKKEFNKIIKKGCISGSKIVENLVQQIAEKEGVADKKNIESIKEMILNGLSYDFYGESMGKLKESVSEKDFDLNFEEKKINFKIKGFIDKLFINKDSALIRDFKSSKEVFKGKDLEDNMQDLMYVLAVKKMYPEIKTIKSEFVFLKYPHEKGVVKMPEISDEEIEGFEQQLTAIQNYLDNFNEKTALKNLAAKADYPKDNSFGGPLMCGYAKSPNEKKTDGTPKWHCPAKFPFKFYQVKDESDKIIDSCFTEDLEKYKEKYPDKKFVLFDYKGCPAFVRK